MTALQVDGGAEFMAKFEAACQTRQLPLFVLPSKSPKLNGGVERVNGTWRSEFYTVYLPSTLAELNRLIASFHISTTTIGPTASCRASPPRSTLPSTTARNPSVSNVLNQDRILLSSSDEFKLGVRLPGQGGHRIVPAAAQRM